jgi:hypothetical protein
MPAEETGLYIHIKTVHLRPKSDGNPGKEVLEFGDAVRPLQRLGEWVEVSCPARQRQGWVHLLAITESREALDDLKTRGRFPRSITRIEGRLGGRKDGVGDGMSAVNLVEFRTVDWDKMKKLVDGAKANPANKSDLTPENLVGDCVTFNSAAVELLNRPDKNLKQIWLNYVKQAGFEKPDKVYIYIEAKRFEVLPLAAADERAVDALVEKAAARR